jgi:hypothetical protein
MIDPISAFFILVTEFGSRMDGLLAFKVTFEKQIDSARETPWFDGSLGHFENKSRMKQLGAFVNFSHDLLREFCILGIAKVIEDVLVSAKDLGLPAFDMWSGDELRLPYHHNMRCVRNLANVVKHNSSRIVEGGGSACRFLIEKAGYKPGTEIAHIEFDIEKSLFQTYAFLGALSSYLTGVNLRIHLDDEAAAFERFKSGALPWFLERTQQLRGNGQQA